MPRMNAIGIVVQDLKKSVAFFNLLGLTFNEDPETEDHLESFVSPDLKLMLDKEELVKQFDPEWVRPNGSSIGLAFECESPAAVDALYAEVVGKGFKSKTPPWDAFWGQRYAQLSDPDGNNVDLYASL